MNEWTSLELGGICSVIASPAFTVALAGKNLKTVAPPARSLPAWIAFWRSPVPWPAESCSVFFSAFASSFLAALRSFLADGIGRPGLTTLTFASMPGCTVQMYV